MTSGIRKTINDVLSDALKGEIGDAMKETANDTIQYVLSRFIGNALDEDIFERYCDNIAWDIVRAVDQVMEQVFDEPAEEDVADELNTELGRMARKDYAIEIRQQSVVPRQAAGRQLGRCLHLAHIFGGSFGDGDHTVQGGASVLISRIFPPIPHRAGGPSKTEALTVQLHRQEALLCFRFYGEALTLEVEG